MNKIFKTFLIVSILITTVFYPFSKTSEVLAASLNYSPDSIIIYSNLTGNVSAIQENVSTPDANWLLSSSASSNTNLEVSLQNPTIDLKSGNNLQTVKVLVRKNASGGNDPTGTLTVYENNGGTRTQIATISQSIPDGTTILSVSFDSTSLVDKKGTNLEVVVSGVPAGGSGSTKRTVEVGAVNFITEVSIAPFGAPPNFTFKSSSSKSITLSWEPVDQAINYELKRNGNIIYSGPNTSFLDVNLTKNTSYLYEVKAISSTTSSTPSTLTGITLKDDWLSTSSGFRHNLAIKVDGTLWSWGDNSNGQLGLSDLNNRNTPTQIGTDNDWEMVFASMFSSIGIKSDGTIWSWGDNYFGQLGLGDNVDRTIPTQVGVSNDWKMISSSSYSVLAIKNNGTLWSWGDNRYGQLGLGDKIDRNTPTQIGTASDWKSISSEQSSFAIKTNNTLWSWGFNNKGNLGLGDTIARTTPTQVGNLSNWKNVSAGSNHTLAMKTDNSLWTWGGNNSGEWGNGSTATFNRTTPEQVGTDLDWNNIDTGAANSMAQKNNGNIWVWGLNANGQLGIGDFNNRNVLTLLNSETNWINYSVGDYHTTAVKSDGTLWSWGHNLYGQLGLGDSIDRNIPTQVGSSIGDLSIYTPSAINFITTIDSPIKTIHATLDPLIIKDSRGTGDGWHVLISSTPFREVAPAGGFNTGFTPLSLPAGSLRLNAPTVSAINGTTSGNPTINGVSWLIDDGNNHTIASALAGNGMGEYEFVFPSNSLELSLDSSVKLNDQIHYPTNPTLFESIITWNVVTGP